MNNIDITDAVKTAYKLQSIFKNAYIQYWGKNQWAVDYITDNQNKGAFLDFLLKDDVTPYEFRKTSLENAVYGFIALEKRLEIQVILKKDGVENLIEFLKDPNEMTKLIIDNANLELKYMINDEKKYFSDLNNNNNNKNAPKTKTKSSIKSF